MTIHTTVTTVGATIVVAIDGVLDMSSVDQLQNDLTNVIRRHSGDTLVVDLDATRALDDAALGVLLGAAATARDAGGDLQVVCTREALRTRLERSRFDRAVDVRASIG
ncbi:MAG: STAS domain-containing protein [Ilumatobacteraceae bacterium]